MKPTAIFTKKPKQTITFTPKPIPEIRKIPLNTIAKTPQSKALNKMKA